MGYCIFVAVKSADIRFDAGSPLFLASREFGKSLLSWGKDNSTSAHADNRKKNILTIGKGLTSRLDDTVIKAETEYSINITKKKCNSAIQ